MITTSTGEGELRLISTSAQQSNVSQPPPVLQGHSMVILGQSSEKNGEWIIFGGRTNSTKENNGTRNILDGMWHGSVDNGLNVHWKGLIGLEPQPIPPRHNHTSVLFETSCEMVIFGGSNTESYLNDVAIVKLDFSDKECTQMQAQVLNQVGDWPRQRHGHTAITYKDKQMIVFGGKYGFGTTDDLYGNDVWSFDVEKKTWTELFHSNATSTSSLPQARCWHSSVLYKERYMLVFGGFYTRHHQECYLNDLWSFDLETLQWTCLLQDSGNKVKKQLKSIKQRNRHGMVVCDDTLFVLFGNFFDGSRDHFLSDVYSLNLLSFFSQKRVKDAKTNWKCISIKPLDEASREMLKEGRGHCTFYAPPTNRLESDGGHSILFFGGESYKKRHNSIFHLRTK